MERGRKMTLNGLPSLFLYVLGIFIVAFTFRNALRKNSRPNKNDWEQHLIDEHNLQFIRNKPIDESLFLKVDFNQFPNVSELNCQQRYIELLRFVKLPMINLKNQSNYDLKSQYGPQVVEVVSNYEQTYIQCMQAAIRYAETLQEYHYEKEAQITLEACVKNHCDLSKCYTMLISLYKKQSNIKALEELKCIVNTEMVTSPFYNKIIRLFDENLKESV